MNFGPTCLEPTPIFNPYSSPFNWKEFCVRQEEYDAFFDHGLGPDCLPNTGDEVAFSSALLNEVQRAQSDAECAAGDYFFEFACTCFKESTCDVDCAALNPDFPIQNPLAACECTTPEVFQQIFDHGLTDCGRVQEPQEIIERTSEQLSFDDFEGCKITYTATRTTVDSQGNVLSGPEEFTGEEDVFDDVCCNEFAMGNEALEGACDFDLETIQEGYEFEDGQCKFVS